MTKTWLYLSATAFLLTANASAAATFNFVSMADNNSDPNFIGSVEKNWSDVFPGGLTIDGITLNASGSNVNQTFADAFFDKGNAGLGVCSTTHGSTGSSGCATGIGSNTSDDNVQNSQGGETLTLDFGKTVSISDIFFNDDGHVALSGGLNINGNAVTVSNGLVTDGFEFLSGSSVYNFSYTQSQFYLASATVAPVPLPATGFLFLSALGGLGLARRRRKAA